MLQNWQVSFALLSRILKSWKIVQLTCSLTTPQLVEVLCTWQDLLGGELRNMTAKGSLLGHPKKFLRKESIMWESQARKIGTTLLTHLHTSTNTYTHANTQRNTRTHMYTICTWTQPAYLHEMKMDLVSWALEVCRQSPMRDHALTKTSRQQLKSPHSFKWCFVLKLTPCHGKNILCLRVDYKATCYSRNLLYLWVDYQSLTTGKHTDVQASALNPGACEESLSWTKSLQKFVDSISKLQWLWKGCSRQHCPLSCSRHLPISGQCRLS